MPTSLSELDGEWELLRIPSTGEWVYRVQPTSSCGMSIPAWGIYFVFQMVMAYIVLSIMIGIILENFANVGSETKKIRMEDLEDFREVHQEQLGKVKNLGFGERGIDTSRHVFGLPSQRGHARIRAGARRSARRDRDRRRDRSHCRCNEEWLH